MRKLIYWVAIGSLLCLNAAFADSADSQDLISAEEMDQIIEENTADANTLSDLSTESATIEDRHGGRPGYPGHPGHGGYPGYPGHPGHGGWNPGYPGHPGHGGWHPGPGHGRSVICYAKNRRGRVFEATGYNARETQMRALNACNYNSYSSCYEDGCRWY